MKRKNKKYFLHKSEISYNNVNTSECSRLYPDIAYQGGVEPYEDYADYIDAKSLVKAVRIA
ncbi:hypothetical protein M3231_15375 [Neobacillus mesonae]|nr:hypothetical protein [Neobacillus mesonae]